MIIKVSNKIAELRSRAKAACWVHAPELGVQVPPPLPF